ncbi:hypothetical protein B0H13DRAFT_2390129 [Mycena leptocephala]|nr:hypothetical protein B0H13DRAFT_2390129 [Mycena leptocephala]
MDIKDCGIKMPAELSIRHSNISVGKGVTGKSALPYKTAQCSARTEFPVLASPCPFSCFYATLHHHTSICTSAAHACSHFAWLLNFCCALDVSRTPARCSHDYSISAARSLFPARSHPLAVSCAQHFLLRLALPPPPRASPSASRFPLRLASLHFASPAKLSQAPNTTKTGYRMSRVRIWSSKNGVSHHFVIALERHIRSGNGITK